MTVGYFLAGFSNYFLVTFCSRHRLFGLFLLIFFFCHCGYLSFVRFDYGYNMKANVTVGKTLFVKFIIIINIVKTSRKLESR